jgi:hypothetical protein
MKAPLCAAVCLAAACSHAPPPSAEAASRPDPVASFEVVRAVLQSPRCVNCHPAGDAPTQGDDARVHAMFVRRGPEGRGEPGLACATCHGKQNPPDSYGPHVPPGVSSEWRLPPPQHPLVFAGLGSAALCAQLKDPKRNGGLTLDGLVHHVSGDPLVLWGWAPGFGRRPVPVTHEEFVRAFKAWVDGGAPCAPQAASNP